MQYTYIEDSNGRVLKLQSDGSKITVNAFIPQDPSNRYYIEYQEWINAGNTPLPKDTPIECIDPATLTVDEPCKLRIIKKLKEKEVKQLASSYIYSVYPDEKQKFDERDESYFTNFLKAHTIDEIAFRKALIDVVLDLYNSVVDYNTALSNLLQMFPVPVDANGVYLANPIVWERSIDQLLKVAIRTEFIQRVKTELKVYLDQIESATDVQTVQNISPVFVTKWLGI